MTQQFIAHERAVGGGKADKAPDRIAHARATRCDLILQAVLVNAGNAGNAPEKSHCHGVSECPDAQEPGGGELLEHGPPADRAAFATQPLLARFEW